MKKKIEPIKLILMGESKEEIVYITEFSMVEPSTWLCRFKTTDGKILEAHGLMIKFEGDVNSLPPCK